MSNIPLSDQEFNALLRDSLKYLSYGWSVFPVDVKKEPAVTSWAVRQYRAATEEELTEEFHQARDRVAGVAVIPGNSMSPPLACRDFDDPVAYQKWSRAHPDLALSLPTVKTPNGYHVYFRQGKGGSMVCRHYADGEFRGSVGCYVVLPGSRSEDGVYRWIGPVPDKGDFKVLPTRTTGLKEVWNESAIPSGKKASKKSQAERKPRTPYFLLLLCPSQVLDKSDEVDPDVREAVYRAVPRRPGERNHRLLKLARSLSKIYAGKGVGACQEAVRLWWAASCMLRAISTRNFRVTWAEFCDAWELVAGKEWRDPLGEAQAAGSDHTLPAGKLLGACRSLADESGTFYLSVRDAGRLAGVSKSTGARLLSELMDRGVLEVVAKGTRHVVQRLATVYKLVDSKDILDRIPNDETVTTQPPDGVLEAESRGPDLIARGRRLDGGERPRRRRRCGAEAHQRLESASSPPCGHRGTRPLDRRSEVLSAVPRRCRGVPAGVVRRGRPGNGGEVLPLAKRPLHGTFRRADRGPDGSPGRGRGVGHGDDPRRRGSRGNGPLPRHPDHRKESRWKTRYSGHAGVEAGLEIDRRCQRRGNANASRQEHRPGRLRRQRDVLRDLLGQPRREDAYLEGAAEAERVHPARPPQRHFKRVRPGGGQVPRQRVARRNPVAGVPGHGDRPRAPVAGGVVDGGRGRGGLCHPGADVGEARRATPARANQETSGVLMKRSLVVDLDGVIADCVRQSMVTRDKHIPYKDVRWHYPLQLGFSDTWDPTFWGVFTREWWANLPVHADGLQVLQWAESYIGAERIGFLSYPTKWEGCRDGKHDWVAKHFPQYEKRCFLGAQKSFWAAPCFVLLEDNQENAAAFRARGGHAVLVPRPWNDRRDECDENGDFDPAVIIGELLELL